MAWYLLYDHNDVENAEIVDIVDASNEEELNDEIKKFAEDSCRGISSCEITVEAHKLGEPYRKVLVSKEIKNVLTICDK